VPTQLTPVLIFSPYLLPLVASAPNIVSVLLNCWEQGLTKYL